MNEIVPAFQFEIRYNHILNFSLNAREILAPYVKLATGIKIENQDSLEERIILNFEDDNYNIIVNWDRLLIRGQGNMENFIGKNSHLELPFLDILSKIKKLKEFGSITNVLLAINRIQKLNLPKDELTGYIMERTLQRNIIDVLDSNSDFAINLVDKRDDSETSISLGPYFGTFELSRRTIKPFNVSRLVDADFLGFLLEYKLYKEVNDFTLGDFESMVKDSEQVFKSVWKKLK